jgi:anion-transporting  ArsA/GET3 family ATPase
VAQGILHGSHSIGVVHASATTPSSSGGAATPGSLDDLLDRRLLFVLGKGGVGRSTISAALGLAAARRGTRTIVAELSGRGELPRLFSATPSERSGAELQVAPGLFSLQITPPQALEEYLHEQLPLRVLADLLGATRTLTYLAAATPGLRELLCVGKIWELAQPTRLVPGTEPYDLVIVDAPASGHSLGLFAAPETFARAAQGGPIARQASRISETLHDATKTGIVAVATPDDAAVSELLQTQRSLTQEFALELDAVIVNAMPEARFEKGDGEALRAALEHEALAEPATRDAIAYAIAAEHDQRVAAEQVARLAHELAGTPLIEVARSLSAAIGVAEVTALSTQLEEAS